VAIVTGRIIDDMAGCIDECIVGGLCCIMGVRSASWGGGGGRVLWGVA
jgi:hypothetical protein